MFDHYTLIELGVFFAIVFIALIVDLKAHSSSKPITVSNAALWSVIWVLLSLAFASYIWMQHDSTAASLFLTGYVLEKALSVDNLFVFMAIFASFSIKDHMQHRILYYGIIGAILLRFFFITTGSSLLYLDEFISSVFGITDLPFSIDSCVFILFGGFVIFSAYAMWKQVDDDDENDTDYTQHGAVNFASKFLPISKTADGKKFFTRHSGTLMMTPAFLCLIVIEFSDVMFAFDSVLAVIATTQEPFLIFTSNIFAILGLRSLYFLLVAAKRYLCYLEKAVIAVLIFIGVKLILEAFGFLHLAPATSLSVVFGLLLCGILASVIWKPEVTVVLESDRRVGE
jgi:tellurite resistance protein TerC